MNRGDRHDVAVARDLALRVDRRHDGPALPLFSELQRVRVARIGVMGAVRRSVIVAEERMVQPAVRDLGGLEGGMRRLPFTLCREPRPLRPMKERHVRPGPGDAKAVAEEVVRVGGSAVRRPPERDAGREGDRLQRRIPKDVDVPAPAPRRVDARGPVPVVIAGRDVDGHRVEGREGLPQEVRRVERDAIVLVQVASAEERVRAGRAHESHDREQGIAQRLPPPPRDVARRLAPRERGVEMEVGEVDDRPLHGQVRNASMRPQFASASEAPSSTSARMYSLSNRR